MLFFCWIYSAFLFFISYFNIMAIMQFYKGFDLPIKNYKENNLDIPDSHWISLFIIITLWTFGSMIISNLIFI